VVFEDRAARPVHAAAVRRHLTGRLDPAQRRQLGRALDALTARDVPDLAFQAVP
jgi:hypothetical protein